GHSLAFQSKRLGLQAVAGQPRLEGITLRCGARRIAGHAELDGGVEQLPLAAQRLQRGHRISQSVIGRRRRGGHLTADVAFLRAEEGDVPREVTTASAAANYRLRYAEIGRAHV